MSEDLQRLLGSMSAKIEALTKRVDRMEGAFVKLGVAAAGIVFAFLAKQAGLF